MKVYVETGAKRVFCGAIEWPGWERGAKTEEAALSALIAYGPRYRSSLGVVAGALVPPREVGALEVVARLKRGSGTDFGVPSTVADFDREPVTPVQLERLIELLRGAWAGFTAAAERARGQMLAIGPRGGGRSLEQILGHVREADRAYIGQLGGRAPDGAADWPEVQQAFVAALHAKVRGELAERGPRGGERWPARYAVRRSGWHALDHAWELEDRLA